MALSEGTRLGVYEVSAKIGEGGMGEVWRARDTKLDRDVALKVLPEAFTADPDRLARNATGRRSSLEETGWVTSGSGGSWLVGLARQYLPPPSSGACCLAMMWVGHWHEYHQGRPSDD